MEGGVLLVNMPFAGANGPQIALGLLKAALRSRGVPCDVAYLNLILAEKMGARPYQWLSGEFTDMAFAGEWVFAHHFFGERLLDADAYLRYLREDVGADGETLDFILSLRRLVPEYLDYCLGLVDWRRYAVIGFTSTFEQNMASLSLAYEVKRRYPDKVIVMGGSNCGHPMGEAILRCFPFVDYVFTGEADESFPEFVTRLARRRPVGDIKGLVYRAGRAVTSTGLPDMVTDMDALPFPDYDDYFEQVEMTSVGREVPLLVQFETARGCWWGAKQHCTFCGLNALTMSFRAKSKERALEEILHLSSRYPVRQLAAVDNIIDMNYFRELLPELKRRDLGLSIFYETKANLTKEQVRLLGESGVTTIQPGIESLSPKLLKLMRKGVSPLQNVQLLKWCRQFGVQPMWNLLYGIPGESAEDYREMLPLLQSLTHLQPPVTSGMIRLDRYSPYFQSPEAFGLVGARPARAYRHIYPFKQTELADLAYYYEFAYADGLNPNEYIGPVQCQLESWQKAAALGARLLSREGPGGELLIEDTRPGAACARVPLEGWQKGLYLYCDRARPLEAIEGWLGRTHPEVSRRDSHDYLWRMVELRLMAHDRAQFLSLAVPAAPEEADGGVTLRS